MALFKNDAMAKQRASGGMIPAGQVNIIGDGTTIEGTLTAKSDVRISGRVVGDVRVEGKTVITPEGIVEGEVESGSADIAGRVVGQVRVKDRLVLKESARVEGDLHIGKLVIEDGAVFTGRCDMAGQGAPGTGKPSGKPEGASAPKP